MTELEQRAERFTLSQPPASVIENHSYFLPSDIKNTYIAAVKQETKLLSQHILELQKDKGKLTDNVNELQNRLDNQQISIKSYQQDLQTADKIIEQFLSLKNAANKQNEALKILDVRKEAKEFLSKIRSM